MNDFEEYLSNEINPGEKEKSLSFYNAMEALEELYNSSGAGCIRGKGKYDSNICFVFNSISDYNKSIPSLQRIMNVYKINTWDIYITFLENKNIDFVCKELVSVKPLITYVFDSPNFINQLQQKSTEMNILFDSRFVDVINIENILEVNKSSEIFDLFQFLITYNY